LDYRKTKEAMRSSGEHFLDTKVEVDEILIGGPEKINVGEIKEIKSLC